MKIDYSLYELKGALSSSLTREGALLRVEDAKGRIGYADCHPWHELGDLPLKDQLHFLSNGKMTPLTRRSIRFALLDAKSRFSKIALVKKESRLLSHFLINDLLNLTQAHVLKIIEKGFTHVKIKAGRSLDREVECLLARFSGLPLKLRLDCNERLTLDSFLQFLKKIEKIRDRIDFIEDPFPFDKEQWKRVQKEGWRLASDRQMIQALKCKESASVLVLKPALHSFEGLDIEEGQSWVVTSYLGHPVDQTAAAFAASLLDPRGAGIHGLLSHHVYLPNRFSEKLNWESPSFIPPPGFGLGFDEEFHCLQWRSLQ